MIKVAIFHFATFIISPPDTLVYMINIMILLVLITILFNNIIYCGGDFGLAALFGNYIEFWLYINIYSRASPPLIIINYNRHSSSHKTSQNISYTTHIIIIIYS